MLTPGPQLPVPPSSVGSEDRNVILLAQTAAARLENPATVIANRESTTGTGECHSTTQSPPTEATSFGSETADANDNTRNDQSECRREPEVGLLFWLTEENHGDAKSTRCGRQQNSWPLAS